ncbi:hypothetical protein PHA8399_04028 [Leisingera aquaemixtae]|uniref:Uncharacterized protein n=1 Tax=Leisingera aquaemixtae TaxID=1396826 RepID=A0A0P1HE46_9RHOB|nr:hypothetical protein PHA8399_04028 [Leisingera aquaemixtae]
MFNVSEVYKKHEYIPEHQRFRCGMLKESNLKWIKKIDTLFCDVSQSDTVAPKIYEALHALTQYFCKKFSPTKEH